MKIKRQWIYLDAALLGFAASYFALLWVFIVSFLVLMILITSGKPTAEERYDPVKEHFQQKRQQTGTIAGFFYVLGAILAFILKYYILKIG